MDFRVEPNEEYNISSKSAGENEEQSKRWSIMGREKIESITGLDYGWYDVQQDQIGRRNNLSLGFDNYVGRPVLVKTTRYNDDDLSSIRGILKSRKVLLEQIRILNDLNSPMLPEPLEWFTVENEVDNMPDEATSSEPVLILDYLHGENLKQKIENKYYKYIKTTTSKEINTLKVSRLMRKILNFLKLLDDKGYAYIGMNLEHIIILNDDVPRFVGLGRICEITNNHLDSSHINFGRTVFGYSPPELNTPENNWGETATSREIGAYSLGVILHQILCQSTEFEEGTIIDGAFTYPNGISEKKIIEIENGKEIHKLLVGLLEPDPKRRLTDYREIEKIICEMENYALTGSHKYAETNLPQLKANKVKKETNIINEGIEGEVKFFDYAKGFGFLEESETGKEYYITKEVVEEANLYNLNDSPKVLFDISEESGELVVCNLRKFEPKSNSFALEKEKKGIGKILGKLFK